ncbi:MAG TPA: S8 family serine peptidase [Vicinamibacterales bacterium]
MNPVMYLAQYTARGVRVAVVDSGVHALHPHVGGVEQGVAVRDDGSLDDDFVDCLGHGTAVAAAIREKAPAAALVAVKVFWNALATDIASLVRGIDEASSRGASVINLSLGTKNGAHRCLLEAAVERARDHGALIVAALDEGGVQWLPGSLDGVVAVRLDWSCPRDGYRVAGSNGRRVIMASGYPRDIPNVPRERNLKGISFAVANASGFVARAMEAVPGAGLSEILEALTSGITPDLQVGPASDVKAR